MPNIPFAPIEIIFCAIFSAHKKTLDFIWLGRSEYAIKSEPEYLNRLIIICTDGGKIL